MEFALRLWWLLTLDFLMTYWFYMVPAFVIGCYLIYKLGAWIAQRRSTSSSLDENR